jgi:hypothetical protein
MVLDSIKSSQLTDRRSLLSSFDAMRRDLDSRGSIDAMDSISLQALEILTSSKLMDALDLSKEPSSVREKFGKGDPKNYGDGAPRNLEHFLMARRLIEAGARVVTLNFGRWDFHSNNFSECKNTHFPMFDHAMHCLITDLHQRGLDKDVAVVAWGEFGRTPRENANLGTDHGRIAPMFVFGSPIAPGVSGTNVNLDEIIQANGFQFKTVQHDYRRVFGTILKNWLGSTESTLDLAFYDYTNNRGFSNMLIEGLIKPDHMACDLGIVTALQEMPQDGIWLYPNPTADLMTIAVANEIVKQVNILTIEGKNVVEYSNNSGASDFVIDLAQVPNGFYICHIQTNLNQFSRRIIVRR